MRPLVIGLLGKAGSGKSTALQYLRDKYGAKPARFAGPLKELAKEIWGFDDEQVYGPAAIKEIVDPRHNMSPRVALQRLGDGARRHIKPDIWIEALVESITRQAREGDLFVIEDCRYVNEAAMIATTTRFVGKVIKLECPRRDTLADESHPSEAEVDKVPRPFIYATVDNHFDDAFFRGLDGVMHYLGRD